jgi:hypothetical protein
LKYRSDEELIDDIPGIAPADAGPLDPAERIHAIVDHRRITLCAVPSAVHHAPSPFPIVFYTERLQMKRFSAKCKHLHISAMPLHKKAPVPVFSIGAQFLF